MTETDLGAELLASRIEGAVNAFASGASDYETCRDAVRVAWAQAAALGLKVTVDALLQREALEEMRCLMTLDNFTTSA
jgi:hypothetical protein